MSNILVIRLCLIAAVIAPRASWKNCCFWKRRRFAKKWYNQTLHL